MSATIVATALALSACNKQEAPKGAAPPPPKVLVETVRKRPVDLYADNVGQIDGYVNAEIRARVRGYLQQQGYRDGSLVKAGQLLFTIDPAEFVAALDSARGSAARAKAQLELANQNLARTQQLIKSGTVTQKSLDDATAASHDAQGQVSAANAAVRNAELNLSYTKLHSPIDGVAGLARVRVGNLVGQADPTLLTTVSTLDPMRVRFPISERDYLKNAAKYRALSGRDLKWAQKQFATLEKGELAEGNDEGVQLILADDSTYPHRGVIAATDREINPSTGTIQVEAWFPNPDGMLRPGQYARVRVRRADVSGENLVVAQKSLLEIQGTFSVAVVKEDNKVEMRKVEVGATTGDDRIVTKGLKDGERVVLEGVQKVQDGAPVVPEQGPAPGTMKAEADTTTPQATAK
ncbi:MAG TPA: efflux RND transporter periplasmic adaptor subunit [Polyangiales bacterium]|nr:efflux RND transporter periplasmic adaptor subunit [Polyangiales bacterium]